MRTATLYRYCLPMDSGVILRDQKLSRRQGWIVELNENGHVGRGEAAPLPGFSQETLLEVGEQLQQQLESWLNNKPIVYDNLSPSTAFGLSMAEFELQDQLPSHADYLVAPLCSGDPDELILQLEQMPGRKVAKVKVGLYEPIRDGMLVNLLLESLPDLHLRLDANRAWTLVKAHKFAQYITPSLRARIDFIEEPCRNVADSLTFSEETGIAIAWDETLQQLIANELTTNKKALLSTLNGATTLIIKPSLIGSVTRCINIIEQAQQLGFKTIISSSLESSLGLTQLARLAAWQTPNEVPGLDTIGLFKAQLETAWPGSSLPIATLNEQELHWKGTSSC